MQDSSGHLKHSKYSSSDVSVMWSSEEKIFNFTVATPKNHRMTDRIHLQQATNKKDVATKRLRVRSTFGH